LKLRPKDLHRTIERNAQRERDYDVVSTQAGYDRWAPSYDETDNVLIALEERELPPLLGNLAGLTALDVGCGTGRWTGRLVAGGARVTAVDFSKEMLARARQRVGSEPVTFVEQDVTRPLPFPAGGFDLVMSCLVIDHIAELDPLMAELGRVCRPGGRVVLSVMHPAMMLLGCQAEFVDPITGRDVRPASITHQLSDYVMALARAGLAIERIAEHEVDPALVDQTARAAQYAGWPLLLLMVLTKP